MTKRPLPLLALALIGATPLAGCAGGYRGVETEHQPVVSRNDYIFDVQTASGGLAAGEAQRLRGWMDALRLGYGDTISLDDPYGSGDGARADVAAVAGTYGLLMSHEAPVTGAPVAAGTMRVVISRTIASMPSCTPKSNAGLMNFDARTSASFGCAVNGNLAAMVANPADLVRGAPGTVDRDPLTGTKAIGVLRRAKPTGEGGTVLKTENTGNR